MLISTLIRNQLGLKYMDDELAVLDRLAGKEIVLNVFTENVDKWLNGWNGQAATYLLTRYLFPVADRAEIIVGLHLLPSYVTQGWFTVAQFDPERGQLIDCAHSMRAYIHRELLDADVEGDDIDGDLRIAREVFGEDFYSWSASCLQLGSSGARYARYTLTVRTEGGVFFLFLRRCLLTHVGGSGWINVHAARAVIGN